MTGPFVIPASTARALREAPADRATVLLLRHSARGPLPPDAPGNEVPLLPEGTALAGALGLQVGPRLRTLHTSPVRRCVETAVALAAGAGVARRPVEDRLLGDPGVYVTEGAAAWRTWLALGHAEVMARLVAGDRLDGLADPIAASRALVRHLLGTAGGEPGVHVFITHDSIVATAAAHCLGLLLPPTEWPWYLESLVFWAGDAGVTARYREWSGPVPW